MPSVQRTAALERCKILKNYTLVDGLSFASIKRAKYELEIIFSNVSSKETQTSCDSDWLFIVSVVLEPIHAT